MAAVTGVRGYRFVLGSGGFGFAVASFRMEMMGVERESLVVWPR